MPTSKELYDHYNAYKYSYLRPVTKETAAYRKRYESVSENARKMVGSNPAGSLYKIVINYFLPLFGLGDTLKALWVKNSN